MLHMKTPLKYAHTSRELIQLHVSSCARRHFYHLFGVFFSLQLCPIRVCMGRDTVRVRICTERDIVRPCFIDRDVTIAQLTSRDFAVVYLFPRHWALRRSRTRVCLTLTETITHRFVLSSEPVFRLFPRCLFLQFHVNLSLGFHRCLDGNCGGSLVQSRISRGDSA